MPNGDFVPWRADTVVHRRPYKIQQDELCCPQGPHCAITAAKAGIPYDTSTTASSTTVESPGDVDNRHTDSIQGRSATVTVDMHIQPRCFKQLF